MIHTLQLVVASQAALDFWSQRLTARGYPSERGAQSVAFTDYDGLGLELVVAQDGGEALRLPRQHEHLRPQLERHLTPLTNPRAAARQEA